MGVTVSRLAMLSHCQALSQACNYSEGQTSSHDCPHCEPQIYVTTAESPVIGFQLMTKFSVTCSKTHSWLAFAIFFFTNML